MSDTVLNEAQNATRIYKAFFGKLPYKRLAMTQQPAINFGQAWPTLVFLPYSAFFDDTYRVQIFGMKGGTNSFWKEVTPHGPAPLIVRLLPRNRPRRSLQLLSS